MASTETVGGCSTLELLIARSNVDIPERNRGDPWRRRTHSLAGSDPLRAQQPSRPEAHAMRAGQTRGNGLRAFGPSPSHRECELLAPRTRTVTSAWAVGWLM